MSFILTFLGSRLGQWVLIGTLLTVAIVAAGAHQRSIGAKNEADRIYAELAKQEKAYLALVAKKQVALNALQAKHAALTAQRELDLTRAEKKRLADLEELRKRIPVYVSNVSNLKVCSGGGISRGYVLFRSVAASYANGAEPTPAPEPGSFAPDADSGVSVADIAELDLGQADAYRACAERNAAWRKYHTDVEDWAAEVKRIVEATQ